MQISPVMRTINETHGSLKQKKVAGKGQKRLSSSDSELQTAADEQQLP